MLVLTLNILLGIVNAVSALLKLKCFECGKKLRLKVVRGAGGEFSIECSCCWRHELGDG